MPSEYNKKGMEMQFLIEIILVVIAGGLLIGVIAHAFTKSDESTKETLCMSSNAIRFHVSSQNPVSSKAVNSPRACQTIDKESVLPTKDFKKLYSGNTDAALAEVRNLMSKCWWMWLEGRQSNMFDASVYNFNEKCFVCYTFALDKGVSFKPQELTYSLQESYGAADTSEKCAGNKGGYCRAGCLQGEQAVTSNLCKDSKFKCCIDSKNECKSKGGMCLGEPAAGFSPHPLWRCDSGTCYVKEQSKITYLDYFQGRNGAGGGTGHVLIQDKTFAENTLYAITFISPSKSWDIRTWSFSGTTVLGATLTIATLVALGPVAIPTLVVAGATTAAGITASEFTGTANSMNYVLLSEYDSIAKSCAVERGVGE